MNLRSIDLNLLVIFDTLVAEGNATRAAEKMGITPSAISHALRRLRQTFDDDLLKRTPRGLEPTLRGEQLAASVRDALQLLQRAVNQQQNFDPATSERTFKIYTSIYLVRCLLPRICARLRVDAPKASLIAERAGPRDHVIAGSGHIQLRVCAGLWGPDYRQVCLFRGRFVVAMRRDHPAAEGQMTLERFVSLPYLSVSAGTDGLINAVLGREGLSRRIAVTIPGLPAAIPIIEHTDLCAVLPEQWIRLYSQPGSLICAPVPLAEPQFTVDMIWNQADDDDPGHRWLRGVIQQEFSLLFLNTAGTLESLDPLPAHRMEKGYPE